MAEYRKSQYLASQTGPNRGGGGEPSTPMGTKSRKSSIEPEPEAVEDKR